MPFYASLSENKRNETLDMWKAGQVECIVATIAFGMVSARPTGRRPDRRRELTRRMCAM